jgi:DNA-binding response OmpR family regulator
MPHSTTLLVVDDEPAVRQLLDFGMSQRGWTVETAEHAERALELCSVKSFDCYIVDKNLPGLSGIDFIANMRERGDDGCFIIMTAFASPESAVAALHLDVDAYLEKPFEDIVETTTRIERVLKTRQRRRQPGSLAAALDHFERAAQSLKRITANENRELKILFVCLADADSVASKAAIGTRDRIDGVDTTEEALERIPEEKPDLLVVDAAVGEEKLTELLGLLDAQGVGAESVVLCSKASLESVTGWINLGVKALVDKPVVAEAFNGRVGAVLRRLRRLGPPGART